MKLKSSSRKKAPAKAAKKAAAKPQKKAAAKKAHSKKERLPGPDESGYWSLRLYVAGQTPRSLSAFANLKRFCEQFLPNRYEIEVVDLAREPQRARKDEIVALPTLVRKLPEPIKRIIGDLSNTERVLVGMDIDSVTGMK